MPAVKVGPNDACPCWSGKKYKRCCKGRLDWTQIIRSGVDQRKFMSIRGRNLLFAAEIVDALGLNLEPDAPSLERYKAAFTAEAVRKIYEAVVAIWPSDTKVQSLLERSGEAVSGLYIGDYDAHYLERALVRHSIYANKILLVDPFLHPYVMSDKFNPILHPESFRAQTLKNVNFYRKVLPWIDAGIVEFIRTPADFDRRLNYRAIESAQQLVERTPALKAAVAEGATHLRQRHVSSRVRFFHLLSAPDSQIRRMFAEAGLGKDGYSVEDFIAHLGRMRESDPDFLDRPDTTGQYHMTFAGGTYEMARLAAQMAGAYLFTDLRPRWAFIEHDRKQHTSESKVWSPFAKAMQNARLSYLNNIEIGQAFSLRTEGRLEGLRGLLTNVWGKVRSENPFSEENAIHFANELHDRVREADAEWDTIKKEMSKVVGGSLAGGLASLASLAAIAPGQAGWFAASAVVGGASTALWAKYQQSAYLKKYPAAFFMDLQDEQDAPCE